ncbi:hypothetical protein GDO81_021283 [Engystomops pustulosus]|uniref:Transmembrane protein 238 n=1 Tax=Engystomops pustulosus TaxID=76066 RepID=A0AAV6Z892_ENGPU|nr:hypothetical protein GDO81_021283 [Engystomops pustulosus]
MQSTGEGTGEGECSQVSAASVMSQGHPRRLLGRCSFLFVLALVFDVVGLSLILIGIFVTLELNGRSFGEFLIYTGGILLFFSLLWWLAWYSLNLEVSIEDLMKDSQVSPKKSNLVQLARKFSERFSKRSRRKTEPVPSRVPPVPSTPSPLDAAVFINNAYSCSQDTPTPAGSQLELSVNGHLVVTEGLRVEDRLV